MRSGVDNVLGSKVGKLYSARIEPSRGSIATTEPFFSSRPVAAACCTSLSIVSVTFPVRSFGLKMSERLPNCCPSVLAASSSLYSFSMPEAP